MNKACAEYLSLVACHLWRFPASVGFADLAADAETVTCCQPSCSDAASPSEYERDLEEVIKDETSGDFTTALLAMLKANRDESDEVDLDQARRDAEVWTVQRMMCID